MIDSRPATTKILGMLNEGILDQYEVLVVALNFLSDNEVVEMADANGFFDAQDEEDE